MRNWMATVQFVKTTKSNHYIINHLFKQTVLARVLERKFDNKKLMNIIQYDYRLEKYRHTPCQVFTLAVVLFLCSIKTNKKQIFSKNDK